MADLKPPFPKSHPDNRHYSLWWMPRKEKNSAPQGMINRLADVYGTIAFQEHMTLIGLLDCPPDYLPRIQSFAQKTAQTTKPFFAEVIGLGSRDLHVQCVFLSVAPTEQMSEIHWTASQYLKGVTSYSYLPHFSLVYGDLNAATKLEIYQGYYQDYAWWEFPASIHIESLAIVEVEGHPDEWKIIEEFLLLGS
jgi:2'-5' RNA ligase